MEQDNKEAESNDDDPANNNQNIVAVEVGSPPIIVTELRPNDVLMGRGAPIIKYEGNVKFRAVIKARKKEYMETTRRVEKDAIAFSIINVIAKRNGRFLQRIRRSSKQATIGQSPSEGRPAPIWKIADRDVAAEKIKQALRDKEPANKTQLNPQSDEAPPAASSHDTADLGPRYLPQVNIDPLSSYSRHFLWPSMHHFQAEASYQRGFPGQSPIYPMVRPPLGGQHASLAEMMIQLQRQRELTEALRYSSLTGLGSTLPPHDGHLLLQDPLFTTPYARLPTSSSTRDDSHAYTREQLSQLLHQERMRNQLLSQQFLQSSSTDFQLGLEAAVGLDTGQVGATSSDQAEGTFVRENLKRAEEEEEEDDDSPDAASLLDEAKNPSEQQQDSSPDDKAGEDALKNYADMSSLEESAGEQTASSSSPPDTLAKKKRDDDDADVSPT